MNIKDELASVAATIRMLARRFDEVAGGGNLFSWHLDNQADRLEKVARKEIQEEDK